MTEFHEHLHRLLASQPVLPTLNYRDMPFRYSLVTGSYDPYQRVDKWEPPVIRYRLRVFREDWLFVPYGRQPRWLYEVLDMWCLGARRVVRSGATSNGWQAALATGLLERNQVEQEWAWGARQ
jgi:hypothetical protein